MSVKGKRKALSIAEKLIILNEVDKNPHLTRIQIAKTLNLPVTTLNGIIAKQEVIRNSSCTNSSKTKKIKKGKYEEIEDKLIIWFKQARSANIPISGTILREKAEEIAKKLNIEFVASNGWIDRMKNRAGLVYKCVNGESKSVDMLEADEWKENVLPNLMSGYEEKNIFNMDECALFFNLLPNKTFAFKGENCCGGKSSKERVTVLLGSNMNGSEKLPLLIVGKSKKPRCFKNIHSLPCEYDSNNSSWMTVTIFERYLKRLDSKMRKEKRKILIFVDNCRAHSKVNLQNIKIQFLPPNATSVLQPMDQGVIKAFKQHFRKRLVKWMLLRVDNGEKLKKVNLLEAINFISSAWESVNSVVIANCFKKAGFSNGEMTEIYEPEFEEEWNTLQNEMNFSISFNEYVNVDNDVTCSKILSVDEICEPEPEENEDEHSDTEDDTSIPSYFDAVKGLETFRRYVESQENVPEHVFKNLCQLDSFHIQIVEKNRKQKTITDFFSKANVNK